MKKKKFVFIILGCLAILILGVIYFLSLQKEKPQASVAGVTLALSPASGSRPVGTVFPVSVNLNTNSQPSVGSDVIITYNPQDLEVQDSNTTTTGVQIAPGTLYASYPSNQVVTVNSTTNKIVFSGIIAPGGTPYTGSGTLATINFKPLRAAASSAVNFTFTLDASNDSNVTSATTFTDMLASVTNASYPLVYPDVNVNFTETLQGRTNHSANGINFQIFPTSQASTVYSVTNETATTAGSGSATISNVPSGNYDYRIKVPYYLGVKKLNIALTNNMTVPFGQLKSGDLNDDNIVNSVDFTLLNTNWGGTDPVSDINQDGVINTVDFALLNANWFVQGQ